MQRKNNLYIVCGFMLLMMCACGQVENPEVPEPTATMTPEEQEWFNNFGEEGKVSGWWEEELTPAPTEEPTMTPTEVPIPTNTTIPTSTSVPEPTATNTPTPEPTSTPTPEPTATPVPTSTPTPSPSPTSTPTPKPTSTPTPKPTSTQKPTFVHRTAFHMTNDPFISYHLTSVHS